MSELRTQNSELRTQKMIKHVVMWKLKEVAEGKTKAENAETMKKLLEGLPVKIKELQGAEVGINVLIGEDEAICDVVLVTECETKKDLQAYAEHPDHQKVVSFIKKVVDERRVVDYES
ncbi:MAG: Dabb family protein [Gracilimonas sp.]|nr:Dabb family protein [Gracilimonas sp.]